MMNDPLRLPAGVEYLEMKEDESTPPRSVEESATRPNSARLLSGRLNLRGGAKPSVCGGGLRPVGEGGCRCGGWCWRNPRFSVRHKRRRDDQVVGSTVLLRWTRPWPGVARVGLVPRAKTRVVDVERSGTTNSPDSTATGGFTPGSVLAAGARRRRTTLVVVKTRDYCPRWWREGGWNQSKEGDIL